MKLFKHQQEALTRSEGQNRVAFFHDMGLGKTFTGAEKMMQLGADVNLIICQKSKIRDWIEHFREHYEIELYDLTGMISTFVYTCAFPKIGIINYELAWRRPELLKLRNFTLMLDESSLIQNRKAKQSNFILKLGEHAENVILLSGTPTAGKYENLWTQCKLLGWNISERAYNSQFVNWKTQKIGWMNPKIIRVVDKVNPYKNVERLKRKLRECGAQFLKTEECFELPEQTFIEVNISKPSIYDRFVKKSVVNVGDEVLIGDTTLTKRLYCRELCGIYSEEKRQAFREILQSTNERLIVFYNFDRERMILIEECMKQDRPVSVVSGVEKDLTAYETESDSVTLIQYQAGAMGLNLQKSNKVIYYTLPERSELFEQSKKRIHRIGQNKPCFYYVMMCKNTVEPDIYATLKLRKDYTDELFRESERKWERKRILKTV
jgi:SNF2 family DNA or RNA helicase